jgi:ADP-heptose:LPS heptosyltransferase
MIVYKIFFHTNTPEESVAFVPNLTAKKNAAALPDTFELRLNYPDPFLKHEKRAAVKTTAPATSQAVQTKPRKNTEATNWPAIKYDGLVKHVKQENELAIVTINGSSNFMKAGETANDIKLIRIYNDSILVSFQNQKRTIKK